MDKETAIILSDGMKEIADAIRQVAKEINNLCGAVSDGDWPLSWAIQSSVNNLRDAVNLLER